MRPASIISLVLLLTLPLYMHAQQVTYDVEHYSVEDGLPNHWVLSLLEHSSGFVWVGTTNGLCRYDGYTFKAVDAPPELGDAFSGSVRNISEVDSGAIIMQLGLSSLRVGEYTYVKYDPATDQATQLSEPEFQALQLKVTSNEFGTIKSSGDIRTEDGITTMTYTDIFGNVLIMTDRRRVPLTAELILATGERLDLTEQWKTLAKSAIPVSSNFGDIFYWGGYNGLIKISVRRSPFDLILNEEAETWEYRTKCRALIELNKDSILISTEEEGEAVFSKIAGQSSFLQWDNYADSTRISESSIRHLWSSGTDGNIFGIKWSSILKMNVAKNERRIQVNSPDKTLASWGFDQSRFIVARRQTGAYEYFIDIHNLDTKSTEKFEVVKGKDLLSKARPTYIFPQSDSTIWYCTKSGLFLLDIEHNEIKHLYLDKNAEVRPYEIPVSYCLSSPHVWVVYDSGDGKLWIGLDGAGLNVLDIESGDMGYFTTADGLSNNTVVGILPDSAGYWLSTFKGLSHFDTAHSEFRNFYRSNGIAHDEFNRFSFLIDSEGKYYFGSMNGVTSFYPEDVLKQEEELKLILSEVTFYDKKTREQISRVGTELKNELIVLPNSNRLLTINMCLNDFNNPAGNTFFYRLVAVSQADIAQESWTALGTYHELRFENLEAGKYQLYLKGVSAAGVTANVRILPVKVNQIFYKTRWFLASILLLIFAALYGLHRIRLRQALKIEKLRTRLSSDLHDDVGGLLSGIALQMDALGYSVGDKHQSLVRRIAATSRTAMEKMRDVVWAIDARQESIQDLKMRMLESAAEVLEPLEIEYAINTNDVPDTLVLATEVRHNLLLIYKEFINNTVKHAHASKVDIKFNKIRGAMVLILKDDGIGFDVDTMSGSGQGIKNMVMRTKRMNGKIQFAKGRRFGVTITVPLR
jgi:signal transduction histidine kinase